MRSRARLAHSSQERQWSLATSYQAQLKLSTPEQCEGWSDLMPLLTWQLWLAKDLVREISLPWQKSLPELTPGRVVQSMLSLLIRIGSPAVAPKRH